VPEHDIKVQAVNWFCSFLERNSGSPQASFQGETCEKDLSELDHRVIQGDATSHLWRFRPSAIAYRLGEADEPKPIHLLNVVSGAISLKDVGAMHVYMKLVGAGLSAIVSPTGISGELRILQNEDRLKSRLFLNNHEFQLLLGQWDSTGCQMLQETVLPLEAQEALKF